MTWADDDARDISFSKPPAILSLNRRPSFAHLPLVSAVRLPLASVVQLQIEDDPILAP